MADITAKREADSVRPDDLSQRVKKAKADHENGGREAGERAENALRGFKTSHVLGASDREKTMFIHGKVRPAQSNPELTFLCYQGFEGSPAGRLYMQI